MSFAFVSKARVAIAVVTFVLVLAGCSKDTDAPGAGANEGIDLAAATKPESATLTSLRWSGEDLKGWTVNLADAIVDWPETGGISITAPAEPAAPNLFLRSPLISIAGKEYTRVVVDLEAVSPATETDLALYYVTDSHGEDFDYRGGPLDGAPLAAGERRKLTYDMTRPAAGGADWIDSTISQLRFDLPQGANSNYIIHSVQVCPADTADCG
jgi:hypothetical protein